jgi:flagellar basal-body rod protein FlgB
MGAWDTGLDFYRGVLELRGIRQQLLSADIANASTPGFKAVDLDFQQALEATLTEQPGASPGAMAMLVADGGMMASDDEDWASNASKRAVKYQTGLPVALDGNDVDLNFEKLQAAGNGLDYEAAVNFTSQIVSMLMTAIKGSTPGAGAAG